MTPFSWQCYQNICYIYHIWNERYVNNKNSILKEYVRDTRYFCTKKKTELGQISATARQIENN